MFSVFHQGNGSIAHRRRGSVLYCAAVLPGASLDIALGDVVELRKPHPCGGRQWQVVRLGADIGLVCQRCGRRVLMPRSQLAKRLRAVVGRAQRSSHVDP